MANTRFSSAVHLLVALATEDTLTSESLGVRLDSHPVVIRRLVADLGDAGIVTATRGVGGGVRLAKDPTDIGLGAVARAVEFEPAFDLHDLPTEDGHPLDAHFSAAFLAIQREATERVLAHLDTLTLTDVIEGTTLRADLAELLAKGLSNEEIRTAYRVAGGRMVPIADR